MLRAYPYTIVRRTALGLTLIELMVALAIISVLAGIALPSIKETLQDQRLARSASVVQAIIQEGQSRSIARGGGSGILIERAGDTNIFGQSQSIFIRLVDSPPAYRGDTPGAEARYQVQPDLMFPNDLFRDRHFLLFNPRQIQMIRSADDIDNQQVPTLINLGNTIHVGDESIAMQIQSMAKFTGGMAAPGFDWSFWQRPGEPPPTGFPDNFVMVEVEPAARNVNFRRHSGADVSFSIVRSPRFAIAPPLKMPTGTAIDLTASGIGRYGNEFSPMEIYGNYVDDTVPPFASGAADCESIMILFGSRGEVSRVLTGQWDGTMMVVDDLPVTGDIHLLIGESGKVKPLPEDQLEYNDPDPLIDEASDDFTPLLNPESIWVTVRSRTGEVIATSWVDPTDGDIANDTDLIPDVTGTPTNVQQRTRIQTVIGRTRSEAVRSQDLGSL